MIAAPRSGSGKTVVTLGLLRALKNRGVAVVGLKSGPDYIDPAFLAAASGAPSCNLDSYAMAPDLIGALAARASLGFDVVLCEASMGLFDGVPAPPGRSGASADVASHLGLPVVLVLDVSGQAQSAAAALKGFMTYDARVRIGGVVLNRVGSPRHRKLAGEAIEALGAPILGAIPKLADLALPARHLGLVQAEELPALNATLDRIASQVAEHVDVNALLQLAAELSAAPALAVALKPPGQRIALARDAAFSFIYPHLVSGWRAQGAEIVTFSPLADEAPAQHCDVCWLPGGYPELHAGTLAAAHGFLSGLRRFAVVNPVYGECGGYMVLGDALTDAGGETHAMAALLGVATSFAKRKMTLGYREATLLADTPVGPAGAKLRGHEFHYATFTDKGADAPLAMVRDAYTEAPSPAGHRRGRVSGGFFHVIAQA
jgi:cobyrinic acid a,c-diamide synthase